MRTLRTTNGLYPLFNSLLDDILVESNKKVYENRYTPETRFRETKEEYTVELAVPGLSKEDLNIDFSDNYLTISNSKSEEPNDDEKKDMDVNSLFNRKYHKVISLPEDGIDTENIKANLLNGILTIAIPKKEKVEIKRRIEIL